MKKIFLKTLEDFIKGKQELCSKHRKILTATIKSHKHEFLVVEFELAIFSGVLKPWATSRIFSAKELKYCISYPELINLRFEHMLFRLWPSIDEAE